MPSYVFLTYNNTCITENGHTHRFKQYAKSKWLLEDHNYTDHVCILEFHALKLKRQAVMATLGMM